MTNAVDLAEMRADSKRTKQKINNVEMVTLRTIKDIKLKDRIGTKSIRQQYKIQSE